MKKSFLPIIILTAFIFSSCIDYTEKMKLNNDGSGEITFAVGMSESLINMSGNANDKNDFNEEKIKQNYSNKPGIEIVGSRSFVKDGNSWIEISLKFDSVENLQNASKDSSTLGMMGNISIKENENGNWVFTRKISEPNSQKESNDETNNGMLKLMFSKYRWQYELVLPSKIISTNADEKNVNPEKNTVSWNFDLSSLANGQVMTVTYEKIKTTSYVYVIIGALLLILLSAAALNLTKKKKLETD